MTENGWPACGPDMLDRNPIPGTDVSIPLQRGIPNIILKAAAADIHAYVENVHQSRSDEGGWTGTNSVPTSNHLGGTAFDYNWNLHTFRVNWAGWDANERRVLEELFGTKANSRGPGAGWYEGMVFFAQYWDNPIDPMHFQMGYGTYQDIPRCQDFIKRKIRADGFSTFRRGGAPGGTGAPVVAQPQYWAQPGSTGEHVKRLQRFLNDPLGARLDVDGVFGDQTKWAVQAFQRAKGIDADGIAGPITLRFLQERGFVPDGNIVVPAKPGWPVGRSQQELLEYIADQVGPGHPSWPDDLRGATLREKVFRG